MTCWRWPTTTRPCPNNAAGSLSLQARRPIQEFARHHLRVQRRQVALQRAAGQVSSTGCASGLMLLNSFTWSKAKDNGAGSLENPNGNVPGPQNFYNLEADYGDCRATTSRYNNTTSFVWELPFGQRPAAGARTPTRVVDALRRRLDVQRHQHDDVRRAGRRSPTRRPPRSWCRASRRNSAGRTTTGRT